MGNKTDTTLVALMALTIAMVVLALIPVFLRPTQPLNVPEDRYVSVTSYSYTFVAVLVLIPTLYYAWRRQRTLGDVGRVCMGCGRNLTQFPHDMKVCPYCGKQLSITTSPYEMQITVIDESDKKYAKLKVTPDNSVASVTKAVISGLNLPPSTECLLEHAGKQFSGNDDSLTLRAIDVKSGDRLKLIRAPRKDVGYVR